MLAAAHRGKVHSTPPSAKYTEHRIKYFYTLIIFTICRITCINMKTKILLLNDHQLWNDKYYRVSQKKCPPKSKTRSVFHWELPLGISDRPLGHTTFEMINLVKDILESSQRLMAMIRGDFCFLLSLA